MYQIDNSTAVAAQPPSTAAGNAGYFTDGNIAAAQPPTIFPAEFANMLMLEILNAVKAAGIVPDKTKFNQLALAIGGGRTNYGHDSGVANAYALALGQAPAALLDGMVVCFLAANANTGASTLNLNGIGAQPILGTAHQALRGGEIVANGFVRVQWSVALTAWVILDNTGGTQQGGLAPQFDNSYALATTGYVKRAQGSYSQSLGLGASATLTAANVGFFYNLATAGGQTYTMPLGSTVVAGSTIAFQNTYQSSNTVQRQGTDTFSVNGGMVNSFTLNPGDTLILTYIGGNTWLASGTVALGLAGVFGNNLVASGYQKLPSGLIVQWGQTALASGTNTATATLPMAWPNAYLQGSICDAGTGCFGYGVNGGSTTGITIYAPPYIISGTSVIARNVTATCNWVVLGH